MEGMAIWSALNAAYRVAWGVQVLLVAAAVAAVHGELSDPESPLACGEWGILCGAPVVPGATPATPAATFPDADPAALKALGYTVVEGVDYIPGDPNKSAAVAVRCLLHAHFLSRGPTWHLCPCCMSVCEGKGIAIEAAVPRTIIAGRKPALCPDWMGNDVPCGCTGH